jgi:hypothetical protein
LYLHTLLGGRVRLAVAGSKLIEESAPGRLASNALDIGSEGHGKRGEQQNRNGAHLRRINNLHSYTPVRNSKEDNWKSPRTRDDEASDWSS